MVDLLNAPLAARRPTLDDAQEIYELLAACDIAAIGRSDTVLDDVRDDLTEPGFDMGVDSWLVHEGSALVGFGCARRRSDSDNVDIDVYTAEAGSAAADWLWTAVVRRAVEIARTLGHPRALVDIAVHRADSPKAGAARARGFELATSFYRMRLEHTGRPEQPALPAGVALVTANDDDGLRRAAHDIRDAAFTEHFGYCVEPHDDWVAAIEAQSAHDWSQLRIATVDGVPAGMLLGSNHFAADDDCGYVAILAVLPAYRRRGLGALLLRDHFAADARRGRIGTILHVDANNTTPALGLYESVGMRQVLVIDVWRKSLPT
jgi:mycothiol synthase